MKKYQKILSSAGALIAAGITGMHYTNKIISKYACKDELFAYQEGGFYPFRFGNVFYTKQGKGHPLLLIHQLHPACSHMEFEAIEKELSSQYTVYTIDLLGCGRSDKPGITYTAYLYVQLIQDFIKNVIKKKTHIVASGNCSPLVLLSCLSDPTLFGKIILINPPSLKSANENPTALRRLLKTVIDTPIIGTFFYNMALKKKRIDRFLEKKAFFIPGTGKLSIPAQKQKKKYSSYLYEASHLNTYGAKYLYSSLKARYLNAYLTNAVKKINNSICIIMGKDMDGCVDAIMEYKELNCAIETAILPKTKMLPHLEEAKKFLKIAEIFFH